MQSSKGLVVSRKTMNSSRVLLVIKAKVTQERKSLKARELKVTRVMTSQPTNLSSHGRLATYHALAVAALKLNSATITTTM
jgi:hypothetical protein